MDTVTSLQGCYVSHELAKDGQVEHKSAWRGSYSKLIQDCEQNPGHWAGRSDAVDINLQHRNLHLTRCITVELASHTGEVVQARVLMEHCYV